MLNNLLISNAYAAPAQAGGDLLGFLPILVIFALFYFHTPTKYFFIHAIKVTWQAW